MAKGIYVSATTPGSGKSLIALGLADTLHRHADRHQEGSDESGEE